MARWRLIVIGLAACGSAQRAPASIGADELELPAADCATKATFVEASDSALEGVIVNCITGEKIPDATVVAIGGATEATTDASGRFRLRLAEGEHRVSVLLNDGDNYDLEPIAIRAGHTTVKEIRLDAPHCPPALGRHSAAARAESDVLVAAVLDHYAAGGIVDAPARSDPGPTYVTIKDATTLALPPDYARQYIVTTEDDLQREATRSGRDIRFIRILGLEIDGSCATVTVGGDIVFAVLNGIVKMCCCRETEVFLRRGGRWAFRVSRVGICI